MQGLYDSSITRVWPVFQSLLQQDPTGLSWLPVLLHLPKEQAHYQNHSPHNFTHLLPDVAKKRKIGPRSLKNLGVKEIDMEACFEKSLPPSQAFLSWLIRNPQRMTWPRHGKQTYSAFPQTKREQLIGKHGPDAQVIAQVEALAELDRITAKRAHGKWWAFEGISFIDCFLETEDMILLIEGKRTETLSSRTDWYPNRNQLVRNLEVAQEISGAKYFAVLVIAETEIDPPTVQVVEHSLPHFKSAERHALMKHYLGCITWRDVCQSTGISYDSLPNTAADWMPPIR